MIRTYYTAETYELSPRRPRGDPGVGACQSGSHRRLWWQRAAVAATFIFPRPGKLITDFIEFYNIYITIRTERNCYENV